MTSNKKKALVDQKKWLINPIRLENRKEYNSEVK